MRSPETRETLPRVNKTIFFWNHILPPSYEKLSEKLGFNVKRQNLIKLSVVLHPQDQPSVVLIKDIREVISAFGIPRAIVLANIDDKNPRAIQRVAEFAGKSKIAFFYIPAKELLPPDPR